MAFCDLGDFRLYYEEAGQGETIIFCHGFSLDHRMWQAQVDFFSTEYHCLAFDAKGHGRSDVTPSNYSRADRVDDLLRMADNLKIEQFHLVGLSMGGSTGIGLALKAPERLKSLTLASTGVAGQGAGKKFSRLDQLARDKGVGRALEEWMKMSLVWYQKDRQELGRFMKRMMQGYSGAVWADPMRGKYRREFDLEQAHKIDVPTLIISGRLDRMFVPLARQLHERIKPSVLKLYQKTGHMVNIEQPESFSADLKVFLQGVK